VSGKRSSPTVPAKKKKAPAETRTTVKMSNMNLISEAAPWIGKVEGYCFSRILVLPAFKVVGFPGSIFNKSDGGESGEKRQHQGDIRYGRYVD
jgi:hypothetical protein